MLLHYLVKYVIFLTQMAIGSFVRHSVYVNLQSITARLKTEKNLFPTEKQQKRQILLIKITHCGSWQKGQENIDADYQ